MKTKARLYMFAVLVLMLTVATGLPQGKTSPAKGKAAISAHAKTASPTQVKVTTPKEQFGFNIGDDYQLATYTQLVDYWKKLAQESNRMTLVDIGKTAEGRTMIMAIITSPENQKKIARLKEISKRLALAEGLTDEEARALAQEGKSVIWIDGGLHATECLGAQQLIELVYQMVSMSDPETLRLLNDDILLATLVNPDGMEMVSNWYNREPDPTKRSTNGLPRLYHKYIGHDDNRDFYIANMPETEAIDRIFYIEWFPQIIYNHHQTGPEGTVLFAPPFRDPFNYHFDPLVPIEIDLVAAAMHSRFIEENMPGATMRTGSSYSTWWNGGLRTMPYFHNQIGLLTEAIGNPTPVSIPLVLQDQLPHGDLPYPIAPTQVWHFRRSIDYSIAADRAVLDVASKHREEFLHNIYKMGKNSIERGSKDSWTVHPKIIAAAEEAEAKERASQRGAAGPAARGEGGVGGGTDPLKYYDMLREPSQRDPRGYIIPSDQPDFLTATKFVNALIKGGIAIQVAKSPFQVAGKNYPAGSYVIKTAQAFRPHILDMLEPQDHPNDFAYPGGPPKPPYDNAGWTLAFQMGVKFDRILDGFDGPFEKISGFAKAPEGKITEAANAAGYLLSHQVNDAFVAVNRLLAANEEVFWLKAPLNANGRVYPAGTMYIPAKASTLSQLQKSTELGLNFDAVSTKPAGAAFKLRPVRIGLWDQYGGSMPSGWLRWMFEQYGFTFEVVYPQKLDAGNLASKYDVLVFVTGAIPPPRGVETGGGRGGGGFGGAIDPSTIPAEYREWLGSVTADKTVPELLKFMQAGGAIVTIGSSTNLAYHAGLPIGNALVEKMADGSERPLAREKFYVPGSLLTARVDNSSPLGYGFEDHVDFFFENSPTFRLKPDAVPKGVQPVAWFDTKQPLHSGWAWGQGYLDQGIAVIDAPVGKGRLFLFGPEITFRCQPHGTFKFLFNGIYYGHAESVNLGSAATP